jgi:nitrate/TMAO reductase-like tetraheme cytochrome c subunit
MARTHRSLYRNGVSFFGLLVVALGAALMLFSFLLELSSDRPTPYLGIVTYLFLPAVIGLGILIFLYGMRRESLRRRRSNSEDVPAYPRLDLNDPRHRTRFAFWLIAATLLLVLLAIGAYNGFKFTESVTFCGQVCHTVMEPEFTMYKNSSHARVPCVECHVGSGATWYVKSKLSGLRQVYAVLTDNYQRPIPTPIDHLRPARETCEHCHWPEKFYGAQMVQIPHFRHDEKSTFEQISLALKTGGGRADLHGGEGIHWHMAIANQVRFVAVDPGLQHIAIVKVTRRDGSAAEYRNTELKMPPGPHRERLMDCMDCHNRPSHRVEAPEDAINRAMASGAIVRDLPWMKAIAVDALVQKYEDRESARRGILERLKSYYEKAHPEIAKLRAADIEKAALHIIAIHERNVFPKMKVGFGTYPENIGHRNWPGCFRCHGGRHATADGKVLSGECTLCHTAPLRGPPAALGAPTQIAKADWHPYPLIGKHAELLCHQCHTAGSNPASTCVNCHKMTAEKPMMDRLPCGTCHFPDASGQRRACTTCHTSLAGLHATKGHEGECVRCHTPHTFKVSSDAACRSCHGELPKPISRQRWSGSAGPSAPAGAGANAAPYMPYGAR